MPTPILQVNQLGISFGGLKAVDNVTFDVYEGEILGVIGPNGAGKSTTFNLLSGALKPGRGEIKLQGKKINGLKPWEVCQLGISRTFQKIKVFADMTVEENVIVSAFLRTNDRGKAKAKANSVLTDLGLWNKKDQLAKNLTLADRKKLELARALSNNPKILLVDEMMCGLTQDEIQDIVTLLCRLNKEGITMIIVEHILAVIMNISNRLIVLDHGELIATGTPQEIGRNQKVIEAYLGGHYAAH